MIWTFTALNLNNLNIFNAYFYDSPFVIVKVGIIWSWKNCNNRRKFCLSKPFVHLITFLLCLMGSDNSHNIVGFENFSTQLSTIVIRAASTLVKLSNLWHFPFWFINWIWPNYITKVSILWNFLESINLFNVS